MTNPWVFSGLFCLYVVPDGEIVGEGVLLGLPNERCNSQVFIYGFAKIHDYFVIDTVKLQHTTRRHRMV
jgi:hypothetical protein